MITSAQEIPRAGDSETGRGCDVLVERSVERASLVVIMGCGSGVSDVDEAQCLCTGSTQLNFFSTIAPSPIVRHPGKYFRSHTPLPDQDGTILD